MGGGHAGLRPAGLRMHNAGRLRRINVDCEKGGVPTARGPLDIPTLVIEGGNPLNGTVRVSGSKNAADYTLAACLLTADECVLENVPDIEDVRLMARILA